MIISDGSARLLDIENFVLGVPSFYRPFFVQHSKIATAENVDVYSFGHLMYEMSMGTPLQESITRQPIECSESLSEYTVFQTFFYPIVPVSYSTILTLFCCRESTGVHIVERGLPKTTSHVGQFDRPSIFRWIRTSFQRTIFSVDCFESPAFQTIRCSQRSNENRYTENWTTASKWTEISEWFEIVHRDILSLRELLNLKIDFISGETPKTTSQGTRDDDIGRREKENQTQGGNYDFTFRIVVWTARNWRFIFSRSWNTNNPNWGNKIRCNWVMLQPDRCFHHFHGQIAFTRYQQYKVVCYRHHQQMPQMVVSVRKLSEKFEPLPLCFIIVFHSSVYTTSTATTTSTNTDSSTNVIIGNGIYSNTSQRYCRTLSSAKFYQ